MFFFIGSRNNIFFVSFPLDCVSALLTLPLIRVVLVVLPDPFPRIRVVEEFHGDPTARLQPKVWTRDQRRKK